MAANRKTKRSRTVDQREQVLAVFADYAEQDVDKLASSGPAHRKLG